MAALFSMSPPHSWPHSSSISPLHGHKFILGKGSSSDATTTTSAHSSEERGAGNARAGGVPAMGAPGVLILGCAELPPGQLCLLLGQHKHKAKSLFEPGRSLDGGGNFLILAPQRNLTDPPVNQRNWEGLGRAGCMMGLGQGLAQSEAEGTCCQYPKKREVDHHPKPLNFLFHFFNY